MIQDSHEKANRLLKQGEDSSKQGEDSSKQGERRSPLLIFLFFILFCFLCSLGFWQLSRAKEKEVLLHSFTQRLTHSPLTNKELTEDITKKRFYPAALQGYFDEQHIFLLDNSVWQGRVGYEVYTPFRLKGDTAAILVDRGFVPLGINREILPSIFTPTGFRTIVGLLNKSPAYFVLRKIKEKPTSAGLKRLQYIEPDEIATGLPYPLLPVILQIKPHSEGSYPIEWKITVMGPEKHRGYALQWFALAFTLLIISIVVVVKR